MRLTVECYILLFFTGAFLGWVMEVVCKLIQFGRFINRGFLIGPICPIYGFGSVLVTALLSRYAGDPLSVFGLAILLCGTLEYLTSYVMEKLFHARWWDYSQKRFNLNGRVCADTLIPFGLMGLGMVYVAKPVLFGLFLRLSPETLDWLCAGLCALTLSDAVISATVLSKIRKTADLSAADNTEALTRGVREKLAEQGVLIRRALRAFPYAKLYSGRLTRELKEKRERVRADIKRRRREFREEINRAEKKLNDDLKAMRGRK